jgi:hypothetical protein
MINARTRPLYRLAKRRCDLILDFAGRGSRRIFLFEHGWR